MCKVKNLEECEKRVYIALKTGEYIVGPWFIDTDCEKIENNINMTNEEKHQYLLLKETYGLSDDDISEWSINHNREEDTIYISKHAAKRLKERNGWSKKTINRMVKKIYDNGLDYKKANAHVKSWVLSRTERYSKNDVFRIHGDRLYIFNNNILITSIIIPKQILAKGKVA